MPYNEARLSDGTLITSEAQMLFKGLATLAQVVGETLYHEEDASHVLEALDGVEYLMRVLPFEFAMVAGEAIMGYVDVAKDHATPTPSCERCLSERVKSSENFPQSGLNADLVRLLEAHIG